MRPLFVVCRPSSSSIRSNHIPWAAILGGIQMWLRRGIGSMVIAGLLLIMVIGYLYLKTYLMRHKMKHSGDKNEYQTAQNMQAVNTDAADFFCGC